MAWREIIVNGVAILIAVLAAYGLYKLIDDYKDLFK
jgi:hypothetical protein